jgi:hypothetical protein
VTAHQLSGKDGSSPPGPFCFTLCWCCLLILGGFPHLLSKCLLIFLLSLNATSANYFYCLLLAHIELISSAVPLLHPVYIFINLCHIFVLVWFGMAFVLSAPFIKKIQLYEVWNCIISFPQSFQDP